MEGLKSNPGDTFFDERYQQLLPYFTAFNTAYVAKFGNKAQRKGNTLTLHQLFKQLSSSKAHSWDVAIQNVYLKSTAKYINILPQGLKALYSLPIEQSILYLENAVIMSDNDPLLLTVHNEMKQFHLSLIQARSSQEQKETSLKNSSEDVMLQAYALSDQLYAVLGAFMTKFCNNPTQIEAYFPVFLLNYRHKNTDDDADVLDIKVAKATTLEGGFSFNMKDKINIYITGETEMELYFVPDKAAVKPSNTIKMSPQDIKTIAVKDYANQDDRFFMIQNLSATDEGEIEIILV
jgi:hypothetical protein